MSRKRTAGDEQQILQLFEDGDRALVDADAAELQRIYADDYVQYDDSGNSRTKQDLIHDLNSGAIRFISMRSTSRRVRLIGDGIAAVHGSEQDDIEHEGKRSRVEYIYMDVVMRRRSKWQIVASQLAKRP